MQSKCTILLMRPKSRRIRTRDTLVSRPRHRHECTISPWWFSVPTLLDHCQSYFGTGTYLLQTYVVLPLSLTPADMTIGDLVSCFRCSFVLVAFINPSTTHQKPSTSPPLPLRLVPSSTPQALSSPPLFSPNSRSPTSPPPP